jgi:hypothetical protein
MEVLAEKLMLNFTSSSAVSHSGGDLSRPKL